MYFFQREVERTFATFDLTHIIVLLIAITVIIVTILKRSSIRNLQNKDLIAYSIAGVLLFLDFSFYLWKWNAGAQNHFPIPMHICSWATYLVAASLFTKNKVLFQISFYYGLTGGLLSLLVPEFGGYSWDHMRFYQFFLLHTLIIIGPLYQYFAYGIKLQYKWVYFTMIVMWGQALLAFPINSYLQRFLPGETLNMMFVYEPPVPLPGFLGQTPWYLFAFTILFLLLWNGFFILFTSKKFTEQ